MPRGRATARSRSAGRRPRGGPSGRARWSSQKPGSLVSASSWATRRSLASRSKTPRGRPDPLGQVADGGRVHSVAGLEVLEQDRTELDEPQGGLAPGDDGVHAGTVAVVGADAAVAVAVEGGRVAARSAVTLAGDEIDERRFLGLLQRRPSLCAGAGLGRRDATWARHGDPEPIPSPRGFRRSIGASIPLRPRGRTGSFAVTGPIVPVDAARIDRAADRVRASRR